MKNLKTPIYWQQACLDLSKDDPIMTSIMEAYPQEKLSSHGCGFTVLVRSIIGQQISVQAAASLWKKMENKLSFISPDSILASDQETLRQCGLSRQKIDYLQNIAQKVKAGDLDFERINNLTQEKAIQELSQWRGIGTWTAEMFLIFYALKPDIFPIADIGLQKALKKHYLETKKQPTKLQMLNFGNRWRPWRTVATWYLWRSLDPIPVEY